MIWIQIYAIGFIVAFFGTLIWGFREDGDIDSVSILIAFVMGLFWWLVVISYPIRKFNEWRYDDM